MVCVRLLDIRQSYKHTTAPQASAPLDALAARTQHAEMQCMRCCTALWLDMDAVIGR